MSEELYLEDLMKRLVGKEEIKILHVVWNEELKSDDKIKRLLGD